LYGPDIIDPRQKELIKETTMSPEAQDVPYEGREEVTSPAEDRI
jgi:hypothetical protein